jgi:recombination protein RecA
MSELKTALAKLQEQFGETLMLLSNDKVVDHPSVPTGSPLLDDALGIGGLPVGKITEIFGEEASGKTTLALSIIAQAQKKGANCAFIDSEHVLDLNRVKKMGVNLDKLIFSQPEYGELALEMVDGITRSGVTKVIVVDSVAALIPKSELEGDIGDAPMASQARMMSQAMRKLAGAVNKMGVVLIFTNQLRSNIVSFGYGGKVTSGGNALKFYASIRLEMKKTQEITHEEKLIATEHTIKVRKNKFAPPFKVIKTQINEFGFDYASEVLSVAQRKGLITRAGPWYKYRGDNIGQGQEAAKEYLRENTEVCEAIMMESK